MPNYPLGIHMQNTTNQKDCGTIQSQSNHTTNPITFQSRNPVIGALGVLNAGAAGNAALAQATPARLAGHTDP